MTSLKKLTTDRNDITFYCGGEETLRLAEDGFYVNQKKVPVDDSEALSVYRAFKQFLVFHGISQ